MALSLDLVPGAPDLLEELWVTAWSVAERDALESAWGATAAALGVEVSAPRHSSGTGGTAASAYAEQFALDPGRVRGEFDAALRAELGSSRVPTFVAALNVVDGCLRARTLLGLDLGGPPQFAPAEARPPVADAEPPPPGSDGNRLRNYRNALIDARLVRARAAFARLVLGLGNVDELMTEAVRLRNARHQQCLY